MNMIQSILRVRFIRFGPPQWSHRWRWMYLPWIWAEKRFGFGEWIFISKHLPGELLLGHNKYWKWKLK